MVGISELPDWKLCQLIKGDALLAKTNRRSFLQIKLLAPQRNESYTYRCVCLCMRACVCARVCVRACVCVCVGVVVYSECFQKCYELESLKSIWIFYNALIVRNWCLTVLFFFLHLVTLWLVVIFSTWNRTLNTCIKEFVKRSWLMAILKGNLLQPFQKSQSSCVSS